MKTMEEFYKEIIGSKELQEELKKASDEMLEAFLKQHDCNASAKEFAAFVDAQKEGEIEDDDAQAVAGGVPLLIYPACRHHRVGNLWRTDCT